MLEPTPAAIAADRLRRQLARLESGRRLDQSKGRLADPEVETAAEDAADLASRLARGEEKLFRVGLYLTVYASDPEDLEAASARVRALCQSLLLDAQPLSFRALQGWVTTLPVGMDLIRLRRSFVARSGAGKSYLAKLEALRSLYTGVEVSVIDPEDEYARLAGAVGGAYVHLGIPGVRINPFDLGPGPDALTRRALFIHTLVAMLLGEEPDPAARAALDRAIVAAYRGVGITADPRTHARPAPVLADLARALEQDGEPSAQNIAARLSPFVTGTHRGLFEGPTTTRPDGHLVVFSLRDLPDELKAAGTLLTLDAVWHRVADPSRRRRRLVVVDEAWLLMRQPEGARFLFRMAKSARRHWCGLTVVTQDSGDLLGSDLGQAVVANATTQILLRQAPQAIDALTEAFHLSDGERAFLLSARRGEGLLAAGSDRVAFQTVASPTEHRLVTSDPAELVAQEPDL